MASWFVRHTGRDSAVMDLLTGEKSSNAVDGQGCEAAQNVEGYGQSSPVEFNGGSLLSV